MAKEDAMRASAVLPLVAVFFLSACAGPIAPSRSAQSAPVSNNMVAGPDLGGSAVTAAQPSTDEVCHAPWLPMNVSPLCFEGYDLQFRSDGRCQRCVKVSTPTNLSPSR